MVVEPPDTAVRQDAPTDPAIRDTLGGGQVPEDLPVWRAHIQAAGTVPAIQRKTEPLALLDQESVGIAVAGNGTLVGAGL